MSALKSADARKFVRVSAGFDVRIRTGESEFGHEAVFAHDISTGGLGLVIAEGGREAFQRMKRKGDPVEVEIVLQDGAALRLRAIPVWGHFERAGPERRFRIGFRFLEVAPEENERLEAYVSSKAFEYLFPSEGQPGELPRHEP